MLAAVRVGVDGDLDTEVPRSTQMHIVEIESLRLGVEFDDNVTPFGRFEDSIQIDRGGFAFIDQPPGRVSENRDRRMGQEPLVFSGSSRSGLFQLRVDRGNDDIQLVEDLVGKIEGAIGANAHFASWPIV